MNMTLEELKSAVNKLNNEITLLEKTYKDLQYSTFIELFSTHYDKKATLVIIVDLFNKGDLRDLPNRLDDKNIIILNIPRGMLKTDDANGIHQLCIDLLKLKLESIFKKANEKPSGEHFKWRIILIQPYQQTIFLKSNIIVNTEDMLKHLKDCITEKPTLNNKKLNVTISKDIEFTNSFICGVLSRIIQLNRINAKVSNIFIRNDLVDKKDIFYELLECLL
ncbi:MAG: hypothetical protein ACP6IU_04450 [Candidatus Asgardarchaeia archaeon]